jgi:23S rRNA (cytidine1920-2'-O)/16S rRNA (cytidine1409-2'-O)-methyltransferase
LVRRKLVATRSAAREAILGGEVEVGGVPASKPATLVDETASVRMRRPQRRYVGRGGLKLEEALRVFPVDVTGRRGLDIGASTGGFTDCLLEHGAASVVALDVGYGQLDWSLRNDERVTVIERTNFRYADPQELGAPFGIVVADLSFISLRTVAGQLRAVGEAGTDYILLVKPQFEFIEPRSRVCPRRWTGQA